jgi:hypothetical protein
MDAFRENGFKSREIEPESQFDQSRTARSASVEIDSVNDPV